METLDKKRQIVFWALVFLKRARELGDHAAMHRELSPERIRTEVIEPLCRAYRWTPELESRLAADKARLRELPDARMYLSTEVIHKFPKEDAVQAVIYLLKLATAKGLDQVYRAVISSSIFSGYILNVLEAAVGWSQAEEHNRQEYFMAYRWKKGIKRIAKAGGAVAALVLAFKIYRSIKKSGGTS